MKRSEYEKRLVLDSDLICECGRKKLVGLEYCSMCMNLKRKENERIIGKRLKERAEGDLE
jgi:hypothetical protein